METKECYLCGREGTRGFEPFHRDGKVLLCKNAAACLKRLRRYSSKEDQ